MFQGSFRCFKSILWVIHGSFKVVYKQVLSGFNRVLRTLQFSLQGVLFKFVSIAFQGRFRDFKNISRVFHGSFNIVSKVF